VKPRELELSCKRGAEGLGGPLSGWRPLGEPQKQGSSCPLRAGECMAGPPCGARRGARRSRAGDLQAMVAPILQCPSRANPQLSQGGSGLPRDLLTCFLLGERPYAQGRCASQGGAPQELWLRQVGPGAYLSFPSLRPGPSVRPSCGRLSSRISRRTVRSCE